MDPFLLLLAILPGLLICAYIYTRDEHDREPHLHLIVSFCLGCLVTFPAMELEKLGISMGLDESPNFFITMLFAFVVVAFSEELVKYLALKLYAYPRKAFDEPMDGIVYAVMISMGFATLENVLYAGLYGYETAILRMFTAVPAHAVFAIIMGYYVGLAKFNKEKRWQLTLTGFFAAVGMHGLYDFFLLQQNIPGLTIVSIVGLWVSVRYALQLVRKHQEDSLLRNPAIEAVSSMEPKPLESTMPSLEFPSSENKDEQTATNDTDAWENLLEDDMKD